MTKLARDFAPYAPPSNILKIIRGFRSGVFKWPTVLTESGIQDIGVPVSGVGRVMQTLEFLKLVDDNGRRTEWVDVLNAASTFQYPATLANILRQAYGSSLDCVDSTNVDKTRVTDEFRRFKPERMRKRMVGLFLALCEEAELAPRGTTRSRVSRHGSGTVRAPERRKAVTPTIETSDQGQETTQLTVLATAVDNGNVSWHNLIHTMIGRLPEKGGVWTEDERRKWFAAFEGVLDLEIKVVTADTTAV